jgi:flagella basal body P-ring formation protein FlgA
MIAWTVAGASIAMGVEIALRDEAAPSGGVVRLGDVAELAGADTAVVEELKAVPLMPAPAAGSSQFLTVEQLRDLLTAAGVDAADLTFKGADVVSLGSSALAPAPLGAGEAAEAVETATQADADAVSQRVQRAIVNYLRKTTGHDLWNVEIDPDPEVLDAYWRFGPQLLISGGRKPWTGRQYFQIQGAGPAEGVRVYAKVERLEMAAFAVRAIAAGDLMRATDVELRPYAGVVPAQAVRTLDAIIGMEATQPLREGAMVLSRHVRAPLLVQRGERVAIKVRASGILVRTFATAQQNGCLGDLIPVQALAGKERYLARVSGLRELEVFAGGSAAAEISSVTR